MGIYSIFKVGPWLALTYFLSACSSVRQGEGDGAVSAQPWFNHSIFGRALTPQVDSLDTVQIDAKFYGAEEPTLAFNTCSDLANYSETDIAYEQYLFWTTVNINCLAAEAFIDSSPNFVSYWPESLTPELLLTFPSVATPNIGGQSLSVAGKDGVTLAGARDGVEITEVGDNFVSATQKTLNTKYLLVAKADFNFDGIEDWFVRLDWNISGASGIGTDWIALTKLSADGPPMILWRG
ncbi:hypothetical protein [Halioxenophilus aromaticivorans]|uniref:Lipoprotein n=1 Tax=Halioxenophilus aromaticivorans TaxID=1306992 RepID=A0AAV3TZ71_9ALTE